MTGSNPLASVSPGLAPEASINEPPTGRGRLQVGGRGPDGSQPGMYKKLLAALTSLTPSLLHSTPGAQPAVPAADFSPARGSQIAFPLGVPAGQQPLTTMNPTDAFLSRFLIYPRRQTCRLPRPSFSSAPCVRSLGPCCTSWSEAPRGQGWLMLFLGPASAGPLAHAQLFTLRTTIPSTQKPAPCPSLKASSWMSSGSLLPSWT